VAWAAVLARSGGVRVMGTNGEVTNFHHLRARDGAWELYDFRHPEKIEATFPTFSEAEAAWEAVYRKAMLRSALKKAPV
jgi:hypothetical protein